MSALIFDTETTGIPLHPAAKDSVQPRIIEWGGVLIDDQGEVQYELHLLINPGVRLPDEITKITGISDSDLIDQFSFAQVAGQLRHVFASADTLVAHNLPFDRKMMELELARNDIQDWPWPRNNICTVQEHAEEWGYRPTLKKLYQWYFDKPLDQTHRALDDVYALAEIYKEMTSCSHN